MDKYLRNKRIRTEFKENIEPEEIFLDAVFQKKEEELGITEKRIEVLLSQRIFRVFGVLFFLLLLIFFGKTFQFQVVEGKLFSALAEKNKLKFYQIQAVRGVIYDRNLEQLVFNRQSFALLYNNIFLDETEKREVIKKAAEMVNEDFDILQEKISIYESTEMTRPLVITEILEHKTMILLEEKIDELPGFYVQKNIVREYADSSIFAHLLGYVGKESNQGEAGLEESYEEHLKENPGVIQREKDALGNPIKQEIVSLPKPGQSLVLWLDADLQKKATEELNKSLARVGSKNGVVVAIDPKTGGILAFVSIPSFDNNMFSQAISAKDYQKILDDPDISFFNRVIAAEYPTGSSIKPLIAAAALEEKLIPAEKEIFCEGEISVPNPYFPDSPAVFHDWTTHNWTDLRKAIAESCNVYFYMLGGGWENFEGLGVKRIKSYLQLFGWGGKTGIDLPGEKAGLVPDPEWKDNNFSRAVDKIWRIGDTYNLSIGQGYIGITPLQVVTSFVAIANGGKLYQPKIVHQILDENKNVVEEYEPEILRENFISPENLEVVREGMREAVTYGSSVMLNSLSVEAASKTGTAQTSKPGYYHSWVNVFAPYDNPEIVLTVVVEDVEEGEVAALPVAKAILDWYFSQERY
ncbi:MAG: penicillin-binding protein 2 [bacterium]